jgi:drug/metabolite transporter (DMT)-like permease
MTAPVPAVAALALLTAAATWGIAFPPLKGLLLVQGGRHAEWWATCALHGVRFLMAGAILAGVAALWCRRRPSGREWELGGILALVVGAGMLLQIGALHDIGAAATGFITQAYVVWVPLAVAVMARRWPAPSQVAATAMVLAGVFLLSGIRPDDLRLGLGEGAVLAASLLFALQILILERPRYAGCDGLQVTWIMMVGMALTVLPPVLAGGGGAAGLAGLVMDGRSIGLLALIAVVSTAVPFWLVNTWQRRLPSPVASILYTAEALAAAAASALVAGWVGDWLGIAYPPEPLGWAFWTAAGLILAACVAAQWPLLRRERIS